jgi:hypothetical protein
LGFFLFIGLNSLALMFSLDPTTSGRGVVNSDNGWSSMQVSLVLTSGGWNRISSLP